MKIIDYPSPNFEARRASPVDMIIIHYTGMENAQVALDRLCDKEAKVSAHYLIDKEGQIFRMVGEDRCAWHAGVSFWDGRTDINSHSIGVELENRGDEHFPTAQIEALIALCRDIKTRHPIQPAYVIGHDEIAPERKEDPGPLFPWALLESAGITEVDFEKRPVLKAYMQENLDTLRGNKGS